LCLTDWTMSENELSNDLYRKRQSDYARPKSVHEFR